MSNVPIKDSDDAVRRIDVITRTEGGQQVETQAVAVVDPITGVPAQVSAGGALQVAQQGPVALDTATLAALESINAATGGLTDVQLRATPLQVEQQGPVALDAATLAALESINAATGGLTDAELRAAPLQVEQQGPVALDTATLAALESINAATGGLTDAQLRAAPVVTTPSAAPFVRVGFAEVGAGIVGKAAESLQIVGTGTGMSVSQSGGNLVLTSGTVPNAETVIRSLQTFSGSLLTRFKVILSQRIVNSLLRVELADLIGEGLDYTINSATSVTVMFPVGTNPFGAQNIGQSLRLSRLSSVGIPGRYAVSAVAGDAVTFTVAGWPASGAGTLTLYGWNYIALQYDNVTATNFAMDAARRGWTAGSTALACTTTASPGHVAQLGYDVFTVGLADALVSSTPNYQWTNRGTRIENIPDPDVPLYLLIIQQNGNTAPASSTTATIGFVQVEDQGRQKVRIASSDPTSSHAQPVQVIGGANMAATVSGTVTATPSIAGLIAINSAATTNGTVIKASAGSLYQLLAINNGASICYLKLHNSATVTAGTTPVAMLIPLPPGELQNIVLTMVGIRFSTGICLSITGGTADNDTTPVAAGEVKVMGSFV